jgi:hypothetical protein
MKEKDNDKAKAIRALEELNFLLESDPELIESMSLAEVNQELLEMGLDPNKPLPNSPAPITNKLFGVAAQIRDVMKAAINVTLQTPDLAFAGPAPDDWTRLGTNADESLVAWSTMDSMGNYVLRLEASDSEKWTNNLIQIDWKPYEYELSDDSRPKEGHPLFAVLVMDHIQALASIASIRLSHQRFEVQLPDRPFPVNRVTAEMAEVIRESIARADSFHELMAWQQLARLDIDPQVRTVLEEETRARLA